MKVSSTKQMSPRSQLLFLRLFPVPFILVGALILYFGGRSIHRAKESVSWPSAEGVIQNSTVEYHRGDKGGGTYHAEIRYVFTVDGKAHSGNAVAFGDYGSSSPSHAQDIVNRYPKDKTVTVRYFQGNPAICVLEPGMKGQSLFLPIVGLVFLGAGLVMAFFFSKVNVGKPPPSQ